MFHHPTLCPANDSPFPYAPNGLPQTQLPSSSVLINLPRISPYFPHRTISFPLCPPYPLHSYVCFLNMSFYETRYLQALHYPHELFVITHMAYELKKCCCIINGYVSTNTVSLILLQYLAKLEIFFKYLFVMFRLCWVLDAAHGPSCSAVCELLTRDQTRDPSTRDPSTRDQTHVPCIARQTLNHWTSLKYLYVYLIFK